MTELRPKTRFAPSPTGGLHLGNARTALFNYLFAAGHGGSFVLRIEDTDAARSDESHRRALERELRWLGLQWEGATLLQSERGELYATHLTRLLEHGRVYPCWRTEEELADFRRGRRAAGRPPVYDRDWARLPAAEIARRGASGQRPVMRFRVPNAGAVTFTDLVRGEQRFEVADIGDFVVQRSDGTTPFFFSNAIDDAATDVTHVLRGEDHLSNTARQVLLLDALGLAVPRYGHLPLVVDDAGSPLSKRRGAPTLSAMAEEGLLPAAVVNYAARLGHASEEGDLASLKVLAERFRIERLGRSPAHFDAGQLEHWQHLALRSCDDDAVVRWAGEGALASVPPSEQARFIELVRPNVARPTEVGTWAEVLFGGDLPGSGWGDECRSAGGDFFAAAVAALDAGIHDLKGLAAAIGEATGKRGRALYKPLRVALTGVDHGPELGPILELMGPARARNRLARWAGETLGRADSQ
jgi:glutamyl-tRNA synthetase